MNTQRWPTTKFVGPAASVRIVSTASYHLHNNTFRDLFENRFRIIRFESNTSFRFRVHSVRSAAKLCALFSTCLFIKCIYRKNQKPRKPRRLRAYYNPTKPHTSTKPHLDHHSSWPFECVFMVILWHKMAVEQGRSDIIVRVYFVARSVSYKIHFTMFAIKYSKFSKHLFPYFDFFGWSFLEFWKCIENQSRVIFCKLKSTKF